MCACESKLNSNISWYRGIAPASAISVPKNLASLNPGVNPNSLAIAFYVAAVSVSIVISSTLIVSNIGDSAPSRLLGLNASAV